MTLGWCCRKCDVLDIREPDKAPHACRNEYRLTEPGDPMFTVRCFICRRLITLRDQVCQLTDVESGKTELAHADCADSREISIQ